MKCTELSGLGEFTLRASSILIKAYFSNVRSFLTINLTMVKLILKYKYPEDPEVHFAAIF